MPSLHINTVSSVASIDTASDATVLQTILAAGIHMRAPCGGIGECGLCRIRLEVGEVNKPTPTEQCHLSDDELKKGIRLACQVKQHGDTRITIDATAPAPGWTDLTDMKGEVAASDSGLTVELDKRTLGLAVDLGTSQIRVALWDMKTRTRLAGRCGPNPQMDVGTDVLTRLTHGISSGKYAHELAWLARGAIGKALSDIAIHAAIDIRDVRRVVIVGNTAMLCLLAEKHQNLLLQPEYWTREIDCTPDETASWTASWGINPTAQVKLTTPLAGFVGSDFLAAVYATRLTDNAANALLVDLGSNSEIGLWDGRTLWATSTPCGPSFESAGISCGMTASPGAIYRIQRSDSVGKYHIAVVAEGEPRGICGSGLVDAIACLLADGLLGPTGRFIHSVGSEGVLMAEGRKKIVLNQHDIDVFQRAKSATAAGIDCLLQKTGMQPKELHRICVCGTFGQFLDLANAKATGLIPNVPIERIELHANAALNGCEALLLSNDTITPIETIKKKAKTINMAEDPEFEDCFIKHLRFQPMTAMK